ncbi:MAG: DUF58 domain-containing protein [Planctomycetota bacterium]
MLGEPVEQRTSRLKLRMTAEGVAFLVILAFVSVGAVLRSVNLLILLAGMMCAPLLLNWRSQIHVMSSLVFRRHLSQYVHAGSLTPVQWECENEGSRLNAWNIVVEDSTRNITDIEPGKKINRKKNGTRATVVFPQVAINRSGFVSYRTYFEKRGIYEFGPAVVATTFPFGLMRSTIRLTDIETVIVAPELGRLSHSWDRRLESIALGSEANRRRRGVQEDEFYALRTWRSGDSKRHIHWRSTAKYGTPMIRQHDQKTNRDLAVVIDLRSTGSAIENERCERALSFAATVFAGLGSAVKGQVTLAICCDEKIVISERYHPETVAQVMRCLGTVKIGTWAMNVNDPLIETIITANGLVSNGTPLFVVSPRDEASGCGHWTSDNTRLNSTMSMVHWLEVDSKQFSMMFEPSNPQEQKKIDALSEKWMADANR